MVNNDVVVLVDVEPPKLDGSIDLRFWSYGHRIYNCNYKKNGPPFDLFMKMWASTYVTSEFGWSKMKLVSGPNLIGPSEYMLVFRWADSDELSGTSEELDVSRESSS
jgi:hypothetical protein